MTDTKCCEKCDTSEISFVKCGNSQCPCHTPPTTPEWEKGEITATAERIVIAYANWSGRADNRPQFREEVIRALTDLLATERSTALAAQKEKIREMVKASQIHGPQCESMDCFTHNLALVNLLSKLDEI